MKSVDASVRTMGDVKSDAERVARELSRLRAQVAKLTGELADARSLNASLLRQIDESNVEMCAKDQRISALIVAMGAPKLDVTCGANAPIDVVAASERPVFPSDGRG